MTRYRRALVVALVVLAAAVRLNNAFVYPPLWAYDGFSHFIYIWFMAEHWRVPLATSGWEFFQPPAYYAFMAGIWDALDGVDPMLRLRIGTAAIALLGLSHAWVSYVIVRRALPGRPLIHLLAAGLMLFIPVHLYHAGFLGNEGLNAVFCSWALLALLWVLDEPRTVPLAPREADVRTAPLAPREADVRTVPLAPREGNVLWYRAAVLGLLLGLAMMTKFTSLALVAGAFATLGLRTLLRRDWAAGVRVMTVTGAVMLVICGWYYGRNVAVYGTPFKLSREEFMLRKVENFQTRGRRNLLEYVLFDPVILRRPQWPRGLPLSSQAPPDAVRSSLRESVWTGIFANAWFDGFGGFVLPPVTYSNAVRRSGQILLTLGLVPSVLVLVGLWTAVRRLVREGWDDTLVAMGTCFGAMIFIFVYGTRQVPMHSAVKATYLLPVTVCFSFWFALGLDRMRESFPGAMRWIARGGLTVALVASFVFAQGLPLTREWLARGNSWLQWRNIYGVVYYAGGDTRTARSYFEASAEQSWHLAYENLAALALEEDRPLEALHYLRTASRLQPQQSFGLPEDRERFNRETRAEHATLESVLYYRLGWLSQSAEAAGEAVECQGDIPEAHYNLAVAKLTEALRLGADDAVARRVLIEQARARLVDALHGDDAFFEARSLLGVAEALAGDCAGAVENIRVGLAPDPDRHRFYPLVTGPGDVHSAAIRRRRRIEDLPQELRPETQLARCGAASSDVAAAVVN